MNFEMRWLISPGYNGPEKVLQCRYQHEASDYSAKDPKTGGFLRTTVWSAWKDVPTVKETI
jgi:hypothetical protein